MSEVGVQRTQLRHAATAESDRVLLLGGWSCVPFQWRCAAFHRARRGRVASGFDSLCPPSYLAGMPIRRRTSKDTPAKLAGRMKRRWRVVLLRSKGEIVGQVEAPDAEAAKAAAAVQFDLDEIQRNWIMVQELA